MTAPPGPPPFFADLNLDQIAAALTRGLEQYDLMPYFRTPLPDESAIAYRHQVFRDLRRPEVREVVTGFARQMTAMRQSLTWAGQLGTPTSSSAGFWTPPAPTAGRCRP